MDDAMMALPPRLTGKLALPTLLAAACTSATSCCAFTTSHHSGPPRRTAPPPRRRRQQHPSFHSRHAAAAGTPPLRSLTPTSSRADARLYPPPTSPPPTPPSQSSSPSPNLESDLPTLRRRFRPGSYYEWLYQDDGGTPTSYERYQIVKLTSATANPSDAADSTNATTDSDDDAVSIEMATKFHVHAEYTVHHRMTVNLRRHLQATDDRSDWSLDKFEYYDAEADRWRVFGVGDNVQAFEEKFDIFAMLLDTDLREGGPNDRYNLCQSRNAKVNSKPVELTRSDRHEYTEAWYGPTSDERLSGVALAKEFREHSFALMAMGREGEEEVPVGVELT